MGLTDEVRIVFMGTPAFAVPSLNALLRLGSTVHPSVRVVGVFTQPDRPSGRGNRLTSPPVKEAALIAGLPVAQPERLRRPDAVAALQAFAPDLIVVAAYAQILSQRVLDLPRYGCLNVHASLLPRYRGAAPIQAAILAGDAESGVCIMGMEPGLDTGPIVTSYREPILPTDTAETLGLRLAQGGARLLESTVPDWLGGVLVPQPQDDTRATMTTMLRKEDGAINWSRSAASIERLVRAMTPWPGGFTVIGDGLLKVLSARLLADGASQVGPGTLLALDDRPVVCTGEGLLELTIVQPAGKRPMDGAAWLRGARSLVGTRLGADLPTA